jgi:hypothetical protein
MSQTATDSLPVETNTAPNGLSAPGRMRWKDNPALEMASYRMDERNRVFSLNPLITALPGPISEVQAQSALATEPEARPALFEKLPLELRREYADEVADVFVPTQAHVLAMIRLIEFLRAGYRHRNPNDPEFIGQLMNVSRLGSPHALPRSSKQVGPRGGLILIGPTGSGKTSTLDRYEGFIGSKTRVHTQFMGLPCFWPQIGTLRISASGVSTQKQLAMRIINEIDRQLGGGVVSGLFSPRDTNYLHVVHSLLSSYLVGQLFVEDIQLWGRVKTEVRISMLSLLVGIQESGIPVVCVGTMVLQNVLEANTSIAEKLMGSGSIGIPPAHKGEEVKHLCMKMWQRQIGCRPVEMPSWLPNAVWNRTAGLRRYVRELFFHLLQHMADDRVKVLSQSYFNQSADTALNHVSYGVDIIRRAYEGKAIDRDKLILYEEYIDEIEYKRSVKNRMRRIKTLLNARAHRRNKSKLK